MENQYNTPTLVVGTLIALAIVAAVIIILNFPEMVKIISEEGILN